MRRRRILGFGTTGFHELTYWEWGEPEAERTVVCIHGLTRNGRDFDQLAAALAGASYRVVCPDMVGRGESDRLGDPAGYGYPQYLADLTALLARLEVERLDWVGTSMGGLLGFFMAAGSKSPLRRLVVNDVGPFIPKAALERLAGYVGSDPRFADLAAAETYLREIYAAFGPLSDSQWRQLTEISVTLAPEGEGLALAYDPGIGQAFKTGPLEDVDLWAVWDRIACPTLVLRGERSDLLLPETAREMSRRGPPLRLAEIPGCGHAPALMDPEQIALVRDFLLEADPA